MKNPTISVVIPTYNSAQTIGRCLESIRNQDYPQHLVHILLADGGSTDQTKKIAQKYDVEWVKVDKKKQNVEYNKVSGIAKAKGELLLMVDHDNIFPEKTILRAMVRPFFAHKDLVGVETLRYHYDKNTSVLDRYFALFGVNDPLAYYLGKADRISYLSDEYPRKYAPKDKGGYYLVRFTPSDIPTIGANGFLVRRSILVSHANITPEMFFPIDVNVDLIRKGYATYAFTKNAILHLSGSGDVLYYLKRRMLFMRQYHLGEHSLALKKTRRYSLYDRGDFWKLVKFVIIGLTLIVPLIDSIKGYRKIHDPAWFINPIMCFAIVIIYGFVIIDHQVDLLIRKRGLKYA
jgi:glycosyltransferase involved in cell wall biosynthesis